MNIVLNLNEFDINNIFFQQPVKNTIINNSKFIRIIYSNDLLTLNSILMPIVINILSLVKHYDKYKYIFNPQENNELIKSIYTIEKNILNRLNIKNKTPRYCITDQLKSGSIRLYTSYKKDFLKSKYLLKISGIWEDLAEDGNYGLTFKFIEID